MKKKLLLVGLVTILCLSFSAGVCAGNDTRKILTDDEKNEITFINVEEEQDYYEEISALPSYSDVTDDAWYQIFISHLTQIGVLAGVAPNQFAPNQIITRAEFTKMIAYAADADVSSYSGVTKFEDVPADVWYAPYIQWANDNGLISGSSETAFLPNHSVSREEAATMIYNLGQFESSDIVQENSSLSSLNQESFADEVAVSSWAEAPVSTLIKANILVGDANGNLNPQQMLLRCEAAKLISSYIIFSQKPTIIVEGKRLEYIDESSENEPQESFDDEDSFHKEIAEYDLYDSEKATLSWKSAGEIPYSTHKNLTNQGFYILFQGNGKSYSYINNLADVNNGKYNQYARKFVGEGSVAPDSDEKELSFTAHYCSPSLQNKDGDQSPTAYTKFNNHYYNAVVNYSWGSYNSGYTYLGRAIHYMSDILSPPHARLITGTPHADYEDWVKKNMRYDYYTASAAGSTYSFITNSSFADISRGFATASNTASYSCFNRSPSGVYTAQRDGDAINATRDCLTRCQRAIAGLTYRYLVDTGRNN